MSYKNSTLWLTSIKLGDENKERRVTKVIIYGFDNKLDDLTALNASQESLIEGKKIVDGGFEFEVEFTTGNLALLSSVPILTVQLKH